MILAGNLAGAVLRVDDFGAVGDGKHDDIGAVVAAVDALKGRGPGSVLEFTSGKTYRLGLREDSVFQIDLQGMTNVTVEGNGAMLLSTPRQAVIRVKNCDGVAVRNFLIEQDPLPYSQGTITKVLQDDAEFVMTIDDGYPLPTDEETLKKNFGAIRWDWGSVIDPTERRIRKGMRDHFWVDHIVPMGPRIYKVKVKKDCVAGLAQVRPGDKYFQPLSYNNLHRLKRLGANLFAYNISFENSGDCLLENVTLYSGRSSMCSNVECNYGRITIRGFKVMVRPGTDRVVSNWRDGIHCKDNRIGPIIENCYFESMLDDSINMSQNTIMAQEVISPTTYRMTKFPGQKQWEKDTSSIRKGDRLMVFYPTSGEYLGPFRVVKIDENDLQVVTFDKPLAGVVPGSVRQGKDRLATHFYNMEQSNRGFIIRNNVFRSQRRHAILARAGDGLIENNLIEGVGGGGIVLHNEFGVFYEGPFPRDIVIRNNTIRQTYGVPIEVWSETGKNRTRQVRDIRIESNLVVVEQSPAIRIENAQDILLENNHYRKPDGRELSDPVQAEGSTNIRKLQKWK